MEECRRVGMSVVIVKGDKTIYQEAFGYRDLAETIWFNW